MNNLMLIPIISFLVALGVALIAWIIFEYINWKIYPRIKDD